MSPLSHISGARYAIVIMWYGNSQSEHNICSHGC